jgi:hypothetical protein
VGGGLILDWLVIPFSSSQRREFRRGGWRTWARQYPILFDELDSRNAASQAVLGYHFFEWMAAIAVFEWTGYRVLVKKYHLRRHERKVEIFRRLVPERVYRLFAQPRRFGKTQGPDLFVYNRNRDWFFCEVKGPRDRLRPGQRAFFSALEAASGRPVRLIRFVSLPDSRGRGGLEQ